MVDLIAVRIGHCQQLAGCIIRITGGISSLGRACNALGHSQPAAHGIVGIIGGGGCRVGDGMQAADAVGAYNVVGVGDGEITIGDYFLKIKKAVKARPLQLPLISSIFNISNQRPCSYSRPSNTRI